ncbi:hypothetical protein ACX818_001297 [Acinetobacter baumannii]
MTDLNQSLLETKAKLLDAIEANQNVAMHNQQLSGALQRIAEILGLTPDETGNLELDAIIQAVASVAVGNGEDVKAESVDE